MGKKPKPFSSARTLSLNPSLRSEVADMLNILDQHRFLNITQTWKCWLNLSNFETPKCIWTIHMPWQWLNLNFTVALYTPHSTLTLYTPLFTLRPQHSTFQTLHFTCYTPSPEPNSTLYTLHFAGAHINRNFNILQNPWLDWKFRNWGKKRQTIFCQKTYVCVEQF